MSIFEIRGEILSPIHIGAGRELEPFDYIISDGKFYRVSLEEFIKGLAPKERKEFNQFVENGKLNELRKFLASHPTSKTVAIYSTRVSKSVETLYTSKLDQIENQLLISPFIRTEGEKRILIPGSSIKGAIRTAVISELANEKKIKPPKPFSRQFWQFESQVLGHNNAKNDPFRALKVEDVYLDNGSTIVSEIKNMSKDKRGNLKPNNLQMIHETTFSYVSGKEVTFIAQVKLDEQLIKRGVLSLGLNIDRIRQSCSRFYHQKLEMEHDKFFLGSSVDEASTMLLNMDLEEDSFLLRIGRFSGVESVTLDEYRNPQPPGRNRGWGNSRNIADGKFPMGWVKIAISEF
ncbi:type III-A CRISPR-associated RAMP protein Csm5 [candidate division KSB1 bacterium]|nr:type III-A CRISPR-associated RAMP protein Csm5 [candidate division KSB1 bacterium]NIR73283.1 type III-A CRISPR-associated RAMP protein Csm5 [candidate division KSB1 bacterium]NIS26989.1 type III-A CRISPR-associated RAMP protein Csm5 [candidate division KSB1 bacterium]NIT73829.1 type III-A CRISPR-associated RAMP protein Csm5 [candidate division KSB1 bacterium]NIU27734.1 type III-A CRISPR-associated RAMP protein Csm5 [candidate division KSB1 bacterium]